jgi:hypothetical protein
MKLIAYVPEGNRLDIRPAPLERPWMEATSERFAYRCLPLNIANAHGWEILCASGFSAVWTGGTNKDAINIVPDPGTAAPAAGHFGFGVLTFFVPCLFRTQRGCDLMIQGPINRPKDAISALSGVMEADWAPYSFTMNWQFTRPRTPVRFEKGEPFCHVFPIKRAELESVQPEIRLMSEEPELRRQYQAWEFSRTGFVSDLKQPGSQAKAEKWQKLYQRGVDMDGRRGIADHRTRQRLRAFAKSAAYNTYSRQISSQAPQQSPPQALQSGSTGGVRLNWWTGDRR